MKTPIHSPAWADMPVQPGTVAASLRQLVNAAGPLGSGMAVALTMVQRSQMAEDEGLPAPLDASQRGQLIALCAVSAQMLGDAAMAACEDLMHQTS